MSDEVTVGIREALLPIVIEALCALELNGYTQTEIAKRAGATQPEVSTLLRNRTRALSMFRVERYLRILSKLKVDVQFTIVNGKASVRLLNPLPQQ